MSNDENEIEFDVQKIPLPQPRGPGLMEVLSKMRVGQSIVVSDNKKGRVLHYFKRLGYGYRKSVVGLQGLGKVRIWRAS